MYDKTDGADFVYPLTGNRENTLTKRELIAISIMARICERCYGGDYNVAASETMIATDALIEALNKQP